MSVVQTIAGAVQPWADFYAHHKLVSAAVIWAHLSALVLGGGTAIASDRMVLRLDGADTEERKRRLHDFSSTHRVVITALTVSAVTGASLLMSDVKTFLVSPVYWTKMGLILLLLINGYALLHTERGLGADPSPTNPLWKRFAYGAAASIMLWLSTTLAGVVLLNS
ncbi:MAG TPA: hypothetical protein VHE78_15105 [Gemmatimonadaceae bacterium]|nr:hypothetical protein [Gemmatimonadaceae bacterium]